MSGKKKKQPGQRKAGQIATTQSQRWPAQPVSQSSTTLILAICVAAAAGGIGLGLWFSTDFGTDAPALPALPPLPTTLADRPPLMQAHIRQAEENARQNPTNADAVGRLAMVYHANDYPDQARTCYAIAARLAPNDERWPYGLGWLEQSAGRRDRAIDAFQRAAKCNPNYVHIWARIGDLIYKQGNTEDASAALRRALLIDPTHPQAALAAARMAALNGDWSVAIRDLLPAVQAHRLFGPGHQLLGEAYEQIGNETRAAWHYQYGRQIGKGIGMLLDDPLAHAIIDESYDPTLLIQHGLYASMRGRFARAETLLRRAEAVDPHDTDVLQALAKLVVNPGFANPPRDAEAVALLKRAVEAAPDDVVIRNTLANALSASGQVEEARAQWETIIEQWPDYAPALMNFGDALLEENRFDDAIDCYRRSLAVNRDSFFAVPNIAEVYNRLGAALARSGRFGEAVEPFATAVELDPMSFDAAINLARTLEALNRTDEAAAQYRRAIALQPKDRRAYESLYRLFQRIGATDQAEQVIQEMRANTQGTPN